MKDEKTTSLFTIPAVLLAVNLAMKARDKITFYRRVIWLAVLLTAFNTIINILLLIKVTL